MNPRQTWTLIPAVAVAVVTGGVRYAASGDFAASGRSAFAGLLAAGVIALAVSVQRGADWRGLLVGGCFVGAGLLSWTYTDRPVLVWGLLLVEGVVFAVWSWPWLRDLGPAARLGTAWLGLAYWLLGIVGAVLVAHWQVAAERLAYAGVFGLAVLAVLCRSRLRDLSAGVAAAFLFALGALLLAGSGNLFEAAHVVPPNEYGMGLEYRFWGGEHLLYQPNSMAALAAVAAIRVGADQRYAVWQRLAVTGLAGLVVYQTHSRTGLVILGGAALAHAVLLYWRRPSDLPRYGRRTAVAAAVPLLVAGLVAGGWLLPTTDAGGTPVRPSLAESRYSDGGVTSGRWDTWQVVFTEWRAASLAEQVFGDATTTRAVVYRPSAGENVQLTTDNAAVGALRRGGALGLAAFGVGLGILLWRAYRRDAPGWYVVAVLASLPPVVTSDALLGGTGGTVWVLLLAGEAWLVVGGRTPGREPTPAVTAAPPPETARRDDPYPSPGVHRGASSRP